jgi:hypothetical protein
VPAIALLAATIGLLQWYTAHRRAMLDLFDRRMEVYSDIRSVIDQITASGKCTYEANFDYLRVIDRATFLFGRDVNAYLERLRVRLHNLCYYESMMDTGQRQEMISTIPTFRHSSNHMYGWISVGPPFGVGSAIDLGRSIKAEARAHHRLGKHRAGGGAVHRIKSETARPLVSPCSALSQ